MMKFKETLHALATSFTIDASVETIPESLIKRIATLPIPSDARTAPWF